MTQETRKDPRAKIVSLNVRYKSATVDEFIENHSHDVSRGGIFIKTTNPFPAGTLLKFEIRIQGDKAVINGVGRVVWKRDAPQAGDMRDTFADTTLARAELGFQPATALPEGLAAEFAWLKPQLDASRPASPTSIPRS